MAKCRFCPLQPLVPLLLNRISSSIPSDRRRSPRSRGRLSCSWQLPSCWAPLAAHSCDRSSCSWVSLPLLRWTTLLHAHAAGPRAAEHCRCRRAMGTLFMRSSVVARPRSSRTMWLMPSAALCIAPLMPLMPTGRRMTSEHMGRGCSMDGPACSWALRSLCKGATHPATPP